METKPFWKSNTVKGLAISLVATIVALSVTVGISAALKDPEVQGNFTALIAALITTVAGQGVTLYGRWGATQPLSTGKPKTDETQPPS